MRYVIQHSCMLSRSDNFLHDHIRSGYSIQVMDECEIQSDLSASQQSNSELFDLQPALPSSQQNNADFIDRRSTNQYVFKRIPPRPSDSLGGFHYMETGTNLRRLKRSAGDKRRLLK